MPPISPSAGDPATATLRNKEGKDKDREKRKQEVKIRKRHNGAVDNLEIRRVDLLLEGVDLIRSHWRKKTPH
ncbi:hypothetical protein AAFF_G00272770 [Aldrovandia affinis]|uniref:Uncharacterized protein n=1 Tax=Aldrovandia affinis TaxID=143900 RepID=A0AAD7RAR5_9TELE|nr:hypothetical protein AAFF_G00272770 [Aldrovandia affinis]